MSDLTGRVGPVHGNNSDAFSSGQKKTDFEPGGPALEGGQVCHEQVWSLTSVVPVRHIYGLDLRLLLHDVCIYVQVICGFEVGLLISSLNL